MIDIFDHTVLNWFQGLQNPAATIFFKIFTISGEGGILWILFGIALTVRKKTRGMGIAILVSLVFSVITGNLFLKHIVARPRPCWRETVHMLVAVPKDYSFPSGHTLAAFAASSAAFMWEKKTGILFGVIAAFMAASRLYFYVHYPTDVLAGLVIGIILGMLAYQVTKRWIMPRFNIKLPVK